MGQFSWRTADTNKALLDEGVKPQKHSNGRKWKK